MMKITQACMSAASVGVDVYVSMCEFLYLCESDGFECGAVYFFVCLGSSLWNGLPLLSPPPSSLVVFDNLTLASNPFSSLGVACTGSASEKLMLREALYK